MDVKCKGCGWKGDDDDLLTHPNPNDYLLEVDFCPQCKNCGCLIYGEPYYVEVPVEDVEMLLKMALDSDLYCAEKTVLLIERTRKLLEGLENAE